MRNYRQLYAILNKNGLVKEEVVYEFTEGRTKSLSTLTDGEFAEMLRRLARHNIIPPGDKVRKKMISIAGQMNWGNNAKEIVKRLDGWLLKQKYQKPLNALDEAQLGTMLTIFETKVYPDYLTALNK